MSSSQQSILLVIVVPRCLHLSVHGIDKEIEKAIKKRSEEKQEDIEEDESDNKCGATEKMFKQDEKNFHQCINSVECVGCEYFEHRSNDKIGTIYR